MTVFKNTAYLKRDMLYFSFVIMHVVLVRKFH